MENQSLVKSECAIKTQGQLSTQDVIAQVTLIQDILGGVMQENEHYGKIPGCGDKLVLFKSGAEKLGLTFRLAPSYEINKSEYTNGHREYEIICTLTHITLGQVWGQGVGICSTMESKYRYRSGKMECPECGAEAIIKGKKEFGGGWLCYGKKGGCGFKWPNDSPAIKELRNQEKVENPDIADTYNTVLKMAKKRAQVDAMLTATAASDIFTQDLEEMQNIQVTESNNIIDKKENTTPNHIPQSNGNDKKRLHEFLTACSDGSAKAYCEKLKAMTNLGHDKLDNMTGAQITICIGRNIKEMEEFEGGQNE